MTTAPEKISPQKKSFGFWEKIRFIRKNLLGMNLRNSDFIFRHNPIRLYTLVDNKILTKQALSRLGIPTPKMYFTVESNFELKHLEKRLKRHEDFVLKPANGFGGEGVLIGNAQHETGVDVAGGRFMTYEEIRQHVQDTLSGIYSLSQMLDSALCEEKLVADPVLTRMTYKGIPDIRVVIFRGIPVMAMLRLSTQKSGGKANLHQGGVGTGVNLVTGTTSHAISQGQYITHHPDSGELLIGQELPGWFDLLILASRCYEAVPLGYMGVDIVIDARHGPMILEMNVRPGLMIQMANRLGLKPILSELQEKTLPNMNFEERVRLGQELFAKHQYQK